MYYIKHFSQDEVFLHDESSGMVYFAKGKFTGVHILLHSSLSKVVHACEVPSSELGSTTRLGTFSPESILSQKQAQLQVYDMIANFKPRREAKRIVQSNMTTYRRDVWPCSKKANMIRLPGKLPVAGL